MVLLLGALCWQCAAAQKTEANQVKSEWPGGTVEMVQQDAPAYNFETIFVVDIKRYSIIAFPKINTIFLNAGKVALFNINIADYLDSVFIEFFRFYDGKFILQSHKKQVFGL